MAAGQSGYVPPIYYYIYNARIMLQGSVISALQR
jgi:hypothetical protein